MTRPLSTQKICQESHDLLDQTFIHTKCHCETFPYVFVVKKTKIDQIIKIQITECLNILYVRLQLFDGLTGQLLGNRTHDGWVNYN